MLCARRVSLAAEQFTKNNKIIARLKTYTASYTYVFTNKSININD